MSGVHGTATGVGVFCVGLVIHLPHFWRPINIGLIRHRAVWFAKPKASLSLLVSKSRDSQNPAIFKILNFPTYPACLEDI
jgi:hypothetical protein